MATRNRPKCRISSQLHAFETSPVSLNIHGTLEANIKHCSLELGSQFTLDQCFTRGGTSTELCNENLTLDQATRSKEEFVNFVEGTVNAVVDTENTRCGCSSSLQAFCRVDVGVFQTINGGDFHYYVSELERSLTVCLYRQATPANTWTMINSAVGLILHYIYISRVVKR